MKYIVDNIKIDTTKLVAVMAQHLLSLPLPQNYLPFMLLVIHNYREKLNLAHQNKYIAYNVIQNLIINIYIHYITS